jgi:hypothetical protein
MDLVKVGMQKVKDEKRVSVDGIPYRATEWSWRGHTIEINQDEYANHIRVDRKHTAVNLNEGGLINFLLRLSGMR